MAFKAGAVKGEAEFDDRKWQSGTKRLKKSNESMTKSFIKAQFSVDALKKVFNITSRAVKTSIKNAISFTETQNKFNTIFGKSQKAINEANKAYENLTDNYGLSNKAAKELLSSTGDLLTGLGFSAEQALDFSESIQELSVDLASFQNLEGGAERASQALTKALLGETESAKSLGIVIRQNTKEFRDNVKQLMESQGLTEIQAKAQLILQQAYDQSKNAVGDYARTSMSLANMQRLIGTETENLSTSIGSLFLPIMKDLTASTLEGLSALSDFLEEEKNLKKIQTVIAGIGAGFDVAFGVFKEVGTELFIEIKDAVMDLTGSFKNLFKDLKGNISVFDILGGALKIINIGLSVGIKLVKLNIQLWIDWITVLKEAGKALIAVLQALINPTKWKEAKKQLSLVKDSFGNLTENALDNIDDLVSGVVDGFKTFPESAKDNSKKYAKIWKNSLDKTREAFKNTNEEIVIDNKNKNDTILTDDKNLITKRKKLLDEWDGLQKKSVKENIADIKIKRDAFIDAGVDEAAANKQANKEIRKAWADQAVSTLNTVSSLASQIASVYSSIFDTIIQFQEQELENLKNKNAAQIEEMETAKIERLEKFDEETEANLERIALEEEQGLITTQEAEEQRRALEEQRATEKAALEKSLDDKILEQKNKNRAKEIEQEKKMFEAQKANKIAMVWINAAIGIVGAWAQSISQLGPIAGAIFAGILTAAILGVAIAQCHGKNVVIKMHDGTLKKVQNIKVGDKLKGDNKTPRNVQELYRGRYHLYEIKYNNYKWTATINHILSVYNPKTNKYKNIELEDYLNNENGFYLYRKTDDKIQIIKNVKYKYLGIKNYYGFKIDGNQLYQLEDGTITHNTVVISQQKFVPGKAMGGMASGATRVNEEGGEIITLPDGSQVIPNDISKQIAASAGGGNSIVINNSFRGAIIKDDMSLKRVATAVSNELGRRLDVAL
jgi:hypothetical protein